MEKTCFFHNEKIKALKPTSYHSSQRINDFFMSTLTLENRGSMSGGKSVFDAETINFAERNPAVTSGIRVIKYRAAIRQIEQCGFKIDA